jgi:hypothetical protein
MADALIIPDEAETRALLIIASEAKQSRAGYATLDCRVAALLAMTEV